MTTDHHDDGFPVKGPLSPEHARLCKVRITVDLRPGDLERPETGIPDVLQLVEDAGAVFAHFRDMSDTGAVDPDDRVIPAIMRMAARAVRSMDAALAAISWLGDEIGGAKREGGAA